MTVISQKRTILVCLISFQACLHSTGNPWSQLHPVRPVPFKLNQQVNLLALQRQLLANLTENSGHILSNFDFEGFGNETKCTAKLTELVEGIISGSLSQESITFLDALGKPGPGITLGNFLWLGNYEMCGKGALATAENKYQNCVLTGTLYLGCYPLNLTWTGCSPPECRDKADFQNIFKQIAALINKSGMIKTDPASWNAQCDVDQEFDVGAYAAVTVISIFGFLVVVGTVWYLLEPIIVSFMERNRDDTTVLVDAEEEGTEGQDAPANSRKYATSNQPESFIVRFLKCFSLQKTMNTIFSMETKPGQILCLNGIRVLSINWVVLGHTYIFSLSYTGGFYLGELIKRKNFMLVLNGTPSVDSFFALSGFLVTYLLLKQLAKRGGLSPLQWIAFYLHRYLRLTLPFVVAMLAEAWLYRFVMTGPRAQLVSRGPDNIHDMCEKYWWTNPLYINNFVPWNCPEACMGQGWYLANDMQFFFVAPIFISLLFWRPLAGLVGTLGGMICSAVTAAIITAHNKLGPATISDPNPDHFGLLYNKPWIRITPYLVGILGGWLYWKWGAQIKNRINSLPEWQKVVTATPIWVATAAVQYAVVFGLYNDIQEQMQEQKTPSEVDSVFYESLAKIAWSLSLTIQILLCQCGLGGFINSLLSWNGWLVLSRLTYSVFLLHWGILTLYGAQMRHVMFLNPDFEFAVLYLGLLAMSYLAAAVLYLTVEQPVANLEGITYRKSA